MFKEHELVMLPTNKESIIFNNSLLNKLSYGELSPSSCIHYHLYVLSDDKPKEGDWCINKNNRLVKALEDYRDFETLKKIIATTDSSLYKDWDKIESNNLFKRNFKEI